METANTHITYHLDSSLIYADEEWNCRGKIQPTLLVDLASSIKDHGLQIPVIVWEQDNLPSGYRFLLVAGYRRFFACTTLLRQPTILATVRTDLTEETARILNFTENLERKDLNILEEAKAIDLAFKKDTPIIAIGRALNRGSMWVKVRRMLLELPEEAQQAAAVGLFTSEDIKLAHSTSAMNRAHLVQQIIEARKEGRSIIRNKEGYRRKRIFLKPKTDDIRDLMLYLVERRLAGLATKVLLYTLGQMSPEEIHAYIDNLVEKRLTEKSVQLILEDKTHATRKHVSKRRRTRKCKTRRSSGTS
jgi:ParB/RepB/Spo0J family partition protein